MNVVRPLPLVLALAALSGACALPQLDVRPRYAQLDIDGEIGISSSNVTAKADLNEIVERSLRQSVLWDEVKDRLDLLGTKLSGGQQQRLTLARALSLSPEILCLDEFSIAIDPVTTMRIEEVLKELCKSMTIILVTNLVQQARRLADRTMFFWNGKIVELDKTDVIFSEKPADRRTYEYVNGIFG